MKKLIVLSLTLALLLTSVNTVFVSASDYDLTDDQKQILYDAGYPLEEYDGYMDTWYENFSGYCSDPMELGSFTCFGAFTNFISSMAEETDPGNLEGYELVSRGVYDEVSDHTGKRIEDVKYIYDCLTNRVVNYNKEWKDYKEAGQLNGLDSINPKSDKYWKGMNVRTPIQSASYSKEARNALILCYIISFKKFQIGAKPPSDPHFKLVTDESALPDKYVYFNKSKSSSYAPLLRGSFYYHPVDK